MSGTYSIACKDCKEKLWIGQKGAGSERPWLYIGDSAACKSLESFLVAHMGHSLVFDSDYALEDCKLKIDMGRVEHERI